jgi:hypothetical protein
LGAPSSGNQNFTSRLLQGDVKIGVKIPKRYLVAVGIVLVIKVLMALIVYSWLNLGVLDDFWMNQSRTLLLPQNDILWRNPYQAMRWEYLFLGWDSAWYLSIIAKGYSFSPQSFAFFPGLAAISNLFNIALANPVSSLLIVTLLSGIAWVPLFQAISEQYMNKELALVSTLIFALSPFTFLFTTVAYSEGLFLLLTLGSWWLCLNSKFGEATIIATISAAVRPMGFLIALPIFLKASKTQRVKKVLEKMVILTSPTLGYLSAWINGWLVTGNFFAIITVNEWSSMYSVLTFVIKILPNYLIGSFSLITQNIPVHPLLPYFILISLILTPIIIARLRHIDRGLAVYTVTYFAGILIFGAILSIPRYISFMFPLWINPNLTRSVMSRNLVVPYLMLSLAITIVLWLGFLSGIFVG